MKSVTERAFFFILKEAVGLSLQNNYDILPPLELFLDNYDVGKRKLYLGGTDSTIPK